MLLVWNKIFKLRIVQILQFSLYLNQQYTTFICKRLISSFLPKSNQTWQNFNQDSVRLKLVLDY